MTKAPAKENPFFNLSFEEALERLAHTDKGELAEAMTRDLLAGMDRTRKRIEKTREDIARFNQHDDELFARR